jgi:(2R)-3-sulfolactate dehydrogenase (NADP+)
MILTLDAARKLVSNALERCNTSPANAAAVARALVAAEVDDQSGHGLRRVESYAPQAKVGKVDGHAVPQLTATAAATARVDAGGGFAYAALEEACDWLAGAAPVSGIAAAAVHRSHHCGVAGHWVERLARTGMVGLLFANTPKAIAPAGGNEPLFGTNPIAFAAPGRDGPLVIDLSLSKVARGKIMAAKQQGKPIPEGWALDADGQPTTDAAAALTGSMLPIGDAKGAALALMVELLAAGLTGAKFGHEATSFLDAEGGPPETGQLLLALSPEALAGPGFVARLGVLAEAILAQPGTRLPGASRAAKRAKAEAEGLAVDDAVVKAIEAL